MKFTAEDLMSIARNEYIDANFMPEGAEYFAWKEGISAWADASAEEEYESEEEVREELRRYIKEEKAMKE